MCEAQGRPVLVMDKGVREPAVLMLRVQPHRLESQTSVLTSEHHSIWAWKHLLALPAHGQHAVCDGVCVLLHRLILEHPLSPFLAQFLSVPACSACLGPECCDTPSSCVCPRWVLGSGEHVVSLGVLGVTQCLTLFCNWLVVQFYQASFPMGIWGFTSQCLFPLSIE